MIRIQYLHTLHVVFQFLKLFVAVVALIQIKTKSIGTLSLLSSGSSEFFAYIDNTIEV